jgi:hypothetical protein
VLSLGVSFVLTAPTVPAGKDLWTYIAPRAVSLVVTIGLTAVGLRASWWLVGGRAPVRRFFVIYAYYAGAMLVAFTVLNLLSVGVFRCSPIAPLR